MQFGNILAEMYKRIFNIRETVKHKSLFLFGPRQTGKSTLVRQSFPDAAYYDLLEADTFRELSARPEYLRQTLSPQQSLVIVDEIQKLPALLDEIQLLIERNKKLRVILTGSSARKLKRGAANLLGGRAWVCRLHPLVSAELDGQRLLHRLNRGSLPSIIDSEHYKEDLKAYVGTYLQEEIRAEGLTRSIENFSRFLEVAGLTSGEQINFSSVAADAGFRQERCGNTARFSRTHWLDTSSRPIKRLPSASRWPPPSSTFLMSVSPTRSSEYPGLKRVPTPTVTPWNISFFWNFEAIWITTGWIMSSPIGAAALVRSGLPGGRPDRN